jgi:hypothetical protein
LALVLGGEDTGFVSAAGVEVVGTVAATAAGFAADEEELEEDEVEVEVVFDVELGVAEVEVEVQAPGRNVLVAGGVSLVYAETVTVCLASVGLEYVPLSAFKVAASLTIESRF